MMHHDPDYMTMVPIRAHGRYGLRVDDAERFLIQLVGTAREFTAQQLTDHFKGELESKTKTAILQFMLAQRIGIKSINACLAPLSDALQAVMIPFWEQYGFGLAGFYVTSVEVDNDGEAVRRILDAMGRQSAQVIAGYSWQQERALDVAKEAARHSGGGLLGALMMTNLVGGAGSYDYDTTPNEQSGMGFTGASGTPEPSTAVLGAMAALILGAAGVRKWNRARA
jgi:membrane protease subunit (stomatin/prohibitin family)